MVNAAHARGLLVVDDIVLNHGGDLVYSTDSGYTSIYSAYISWSSPTSPAPKEIYPQQAFDQLFDDGSQRKRDKAISAGEQRMMEMARRVLISELCLALSEGPDEVGAVLDASLG